MIFSILKSPALHNQVHKSQKKEAKIHYYYILCSHVSPRGLGGASLRDEHVWVAPTISWGRASLGSWGEGALMGITYFKSWATPSHPPPLPPSPQAPPRSVVAFVIVIWPCLLNASTVYSLLWGLVWTGVSRTQGDITLAGGGGVVWKAAFVISRGPFSSFILPCLYPGLSNAWANSGG